MNVSLILPNQLFKNNPIINLSKNILIIEEPTFFTKFNYHKMKLILHKSSMEWYYNYIKHKYKNYNIEYIEFNNINYNDIFSKYKIINIFDPIDHSLLKKYKVLSNKYNVQLNIIDNCLFVETKKDLDEFHIDKNNYLQNNFYIWQRKRLNILVNKDQTPLFGKWSFDLDNRKKFDINYVEYNIDKNNNDKYVIKAKEYINKYFNNNPGLIDNFIYPINFKQAEKVFNNFIKYKLNTFGIYEDAISTEITFGSHSVLSSSINIGLISIKHILNKIIKNFNKLSLIDKKKLINNYEGYIRQIIGWRSYIRYIYEYFGLDLINENFFNNTNKLNKKIWYKNNQSTNIPIIDHVITKVFKYAYLHHIERLMLVGNFFLLTFISPNEVYKWFMSLFIDSYEYIMVANIVMSQYNTTSIKITSRPYFSSSNYIIKMSNLKKGEWCTIFDSLYYNFINKNQNKLIKIYFTMNGVNHWKNKNKDTQNEILKISNNYIKNYT